MNKNNLLATTTITTLSLSIYSIIGGVISPSLSQTVFSGCYMVNEYGEKIDLSTICGAQSRKSTLTPTAESNETPDTTTPSREESESSPENSTDTGKEKPTAPEGEDKASEEEENNTATPSVEEEKEEEIDRAKLPDVERAIPLIQKQRQTTQEQSNQ